MKRLLIIVALLVIVAVGLYAYKIYNGKVPSLTHVQSAANVNAANLIAAFEKDSAVANDQYLGKIITVNGNIKAVEKESATVILGNETAMSSIRCSMDSSFVKEIASLNPGQIVSIKGACTGYRADDLGLGSDVVLNRCVLASSK